MDSQDGQTKTNTENTGAESVKELKHNQSPGVVDTAEGPLAADGETVCKKPKLSDVTQDVFRVVLVGKTGMGKSSLGNSLLGRSLFTSKKTAAAVTKEVKVGEWNIMVCGKTIMLKVFDTPGLFDSSRSALDIMTQIQDCVIQSDPGPQIFLYVMKLDRISEEGLKTIKLFKNNFGKDVLKYTIIIFTGKDQIEQPLDDWLQDAFTHIPKLKQFFNSCKKRYKSINNIDSDKKQDVDSILKLIQQTITENKENKCEFYTNAMCETAKQFYLQKQEKEIKEAELRTKIREEERGKILGQLPPELKQQVESALQPSTSDDTHHQHEYKPVDVETGKGKNKTEKNKASSRGSSSAETGVVKSMTTRAYQAKQSPSSTGTKPRKSQVTTMTAAPSRGSSSVATIVAKPMSTKEKQSPSSTGRKPRKSQVATKTNSTDEEVSQGEDRLMEEQHEHRQISMENSYEGEYFLNQSTTSKLHNITEISGMTSKGTQLGEFEYYDEDGDIFTIDVEIEPPVRNTTYRPLSERIIDVHVPRTHTPNSSSGIAFSNGDDVFIYTRYYLTENTDQIKFRFIYNGNEQESIFIQDSKIVTTCSDHDLYLVTNSNLSSYLIEEGPTVVDIQVADIVHFRSGVFMSRQGELYTIHTSLPSLDDACKIILSDGSEISSFTVKCTHSNCCKVEVDLSKTPKDIVTLDNWRSNIEGEQNEGVEFSKEIYDVSPGDKEQSDQKMSHETETNSDETQKTIINELKAEAEDKDEAERTKEKTGHKTFPSKEITNGLSCSDKDSGGRTPLYYCCKSY